MGHPCSDCLRTNQKKKRQEKKKRDKKRKKGDREIERKRIWNKGPVVVEENDARRGSEGVLVVGLVGIQHVADTHVFGRGEVVHGCQHSPVN